ncbi:HAD family hydrolase [Silanimonas sp.]|uniref:HAD family hydrolase n=1 Tax=Silanimonas sp. TaxID=1929290 RepID=UPI001BBD6754|nr:HAD family hydrolase [Silanimonas sp.]MBS3895210.1 HAD hydrolase family protein [Silanimonas sp.]
MTTILATDLDGTFLGGSDAQRDALYSWITERRAGITLIYVTGRSLTTMRDVLESLPLQPDHLVANVGTSALLGPAWAPHPDVEEWLDMRWRSDAAARLAARLAREFPALEPQPVVEGRRLSYFYDECVPLDVLGAVVREAGFDPLASAGRYFDVLPHGVNKGTTLLRLLDALGLPRGRTLVAGDTMNDLALFQVGLRGVAVGGSEEALLARVADLPNVERAVPPGAGAILPALQAMHAARPGAVA